MMIAKLLFVLLAGSVMGVTLWLARTPAEPRGMDSRRLRHNWIERETRDLGKMLARYAREPKPAPPFSVRRTCIQGTTPSTTRGPRNGAGQDRD